MWYGVPDSGAQDFEDLIKTEAPELFTKEPSLMHQLVTTLSPKLLYDKGVPVSYIPFNRIKRGGINWKNLLFPQPNSQNFCSQLFSIIPNS